MMKRFVARVCRDARNPHIVAVVLVATATGVIGATLDNPWPVVTIGISTMLAISTHGLWTAWKELREL